MDCDTCRANLGLESRSQTDTFKPDEIFFTLLSIIVFGSDEFDRHGLLFVLLIDVGLLWFCWDV